MIDFSCANCGVKIRTPDEFAGRKGKCPKCGAYVITPGNKASAPKLPSAAAKGELIQYKCSKCKSVLESLDTMAGREDVCPACGTANKVPFTKQQLEAIKRQQEEERRKAEELKKQEVEDRELQARLGADIRENAGMETPILPEYFSAQPQNGQSDKDQGESLFPPEQDKPAPAPEPAASRKQESMESISSAVQSQPQRRLTVPGQSSASTLGFVYLLLGILALIGGGTLLIMGFINRQKLSLPDSPDIHQTPMQSFLASDLGVVAACGLILAGLIMVGLGKLFLFARTIAQFKQ